MSDVIPNFPGLSLETRLYERHGVAVYRGYLSESATAVIAKVVRDWDATSQHAMGVVRAFTISSKARLGPIVRSLKMFESGYQHVVVMEDCGGEPLREIIGGRCQTTEMALELGIAACGALEQLHRHHVFHGLPSPDHLLVHPHTGEIQLIGFDYGSSPMVSELGQPAIAWWDAPYAAPELTGQIDQPIDLRTDLYALGVTIYEALLGRHPFAELDPLEAAHARVAPRQGTLAKRSPNTPSIVCAIVEKLIAADPSDRYQSVVGLSRDLERCLDDLHTHGRCEVFALGVADVLATLTSPQKLYGRERELTLLQQCYARCANGETGLVAIAGVPGIGKTRLVKVAKVSMEREGALFVGGKVEQFACGEPFAPLREALSALIQHLLGQDDATFLKHRDELRGAVGIYAPALVDFLPQLVHIVGEQHQEADVAGAQALNRIQLALPVLVRALAGPSRPLVIFLDDLQWADAATMATIELLVTDPQMSSLQIIVSYRNNEVSSGHPLLELLKRLRQKDRNLGEIELSAIPSEGIAQWVADGLNCATSDIGPLVKLLRTNSGGNPFVVGQLLFALRHRGLLYLDQESNKWLWKDAEIAALDYAADAAELLAGRIGDMPKQTQDVLAVAACVGRRFDVEMMAAVMNLDVEVLIRCLEDAEREGVVSADVSGHGGDNLASRSYSFRHDKLQEAAKTRLDDDDERRTRWRIGQVMLAAADYHKSPQAVFSLVDQLNRSRSLAKTQKDRQDLIQLNMLAGHTAQRTTAFTEALRYFDVAVDAIGQGGWQTNYADMFDAKYQMAECEHAMGHFSEAQELYTHVGHKATTALDRARVSSAMVNVEGNQGNYLEAVDMGLQALAELGWTAPLETEEISVRTTACIAIVHTRLEEVDYRVAASVASGFDEETTLRMDLLLRMMPVAFVGQRLKLFGLIAATAAELALQSGHSRHSAVALSNYAALLAGAQRDYTRAFKVSQMVLPLCRQFPNAPDNGSAIHNVATFAYHWGRSTIDTRVLHEEALKSCLRFGDFVGAGHTIVTDVYANFMAGGNLDALVRDIEKYQGVCDRIRADVIPLVLAIARGVVARMTGTPSSSDEQARRATMEIKSGHLSHPNLVAYHSLLHMMMNCVLSNFDEVTRIAQRGASSLNAIAGIYIWTQYSFYRPLALAQQFPDMSSADKDGARAVISEDLDRLDAWAEICPVNYAHLAALLRGAMAAAEGGGLDGLRHFDRAIAGAKEGGFIVHEALAQELAGKLCASLSLRRAAAGYMALACRAYQRWGAMNKVRQLTANHADLLAESLGPSELSMAGFNSGAPADLGPFTMLKAAQAICCETEPHKLLRSLMQAMLDYSGATRAVLLREQQGEWSVRAELGDRSDGLRFQEPGAVETQVNKRVPMGVIHYAQRANGPVVIGAARMNFIMEPEYRTAFSPLSMMCLPIGGTGDADSQLVYLESSRAHNVFSKERLEALSVVLGQAAISLSNAELYDSLKREVIEKTEAKRRLEGLLSEKEILLREVHHRVRNSLQVIKSMLSLQARGTESGDGRDVLRQTSERVGALSTVHEILYENPTLTDIDLLTFVKRLCRAWNRGGNGVRIIVRGSAGQRIGAASTVPCGLIINEAVANAVQHAFPEGGERRIVITVGGEGEMRTVEIRDNGIGLPPAWNRHEMDSLGVRLLGALADRLKGKIDFRTSDGTVVTLRFPAFDKHLALRAK